MILVALASAAPWVQTERIDLVSEASTWTVDELPRASVAPRAVALRWLEQIHFTARLPRARNLLIGASLQAQTVGGRFALHPSGRLHGTVAVQTRLCLPNGLLLGAETWAGPMRLALALNLRSHATWKRPDWSSWRAVPTVGIGFGRRP